MKTPGKLPASEWDFRPLLRTKSTVEGTHQLTAATFYEYARESASLRALAARYAALKPRVRAQVEDQCSLLPLRLEPPADAEIAKLDFAPFWNCILWPESFPKTPWLDIPAKARTARMARYLAARPPSVFLEINETTATELHEHAIEVAAFIERETGKKRPPKPGDRHFKGTSEDLIVRIDWANANNSEIAARFADWIRESRPKTIPEPRSDGTRTNVNAAFLTRLGVMRLLHESPYPEASLVAMRAGAWWPDQVEALNLRRRVSADLRLLFQSQVFESIGDLPLIPAEEKPLHFDTAVQRKRRTKG